jgi:VTC domain
MPPDDRAIEQEPPRYERKFVPVGVGPRALATLLRFHPAGFREAYPARRVNSLYFEQPDLSSYLESMDGARDRTKLRLRWYGATFGAVAEPVLELKIKRGWVGTKRRFRIEPFTAEKDLAPDRLRDLLRRSALPPDVRVRLAAARPALVNSYQRSYWISADRRFRITIDTDIEVYEVGRRLRVPARPALDPDSVIVELKYDLDADDDAPRITNALPFRLSKSSKYVSGMDQLFPW